MERDPVAREPAFRALLDFGQGTSVSYLFLKKKFISQVHAISCQWFSSAPLDNYFYSEQIASSRTFCAYEQVCLKSPIIVLLFSLPRCCHTLKISFDMIDFYNQLKNCDIKATLSFFPLKLLSKAWWFCLTLSYVQGGWKHYKEKFTVMKKKSRIYI